MLLNVDRDGVQITVCGRFTCSLLELLNQLRDRVVQVSDKARICDLEDWCVRILEHVHSSLKSSTYRSDTTYLVNRDNELRILHTRQMLDCP